MKQKFLSLLLLFNILFSCAVLPTVSASPQNDLSQIDKTKTISVIVDGDTILFDQPPVLIEGRVMVPIRAIAEKMGDQVLWSTEDQSTLVIHADKMVVFKNNITHITVASGYAMEDWETYHTDVPPQIVGDRTLTPVRAIAECLGATVAWDDAAKTVTITTSPKAETTITEQTLKYFSAEYQWLYDIDSNSEILWK